MVLKRGATNLALATATSMAATCCSFVTIGPNDFVQESAWHWQNAYYWSYGRGILVTISSGFVSVLLLAVAVINMVGRRRHSQHHRADDDCCVRAQRCLTAASRASLLVAATYTFGTNAVGAWIAINMWFGIPFVAVFGPAGLLVYFFVPTFDEGPWYELKMAVVAAFGLCAQLAGLFIVAGNTIECVRLTLCHGCFAERNAMHAGAGLAGFLHSVVACYLLNGVVVEGRNPPSKRNRDN